MKKYSKQRELIYNSIKNRTDHPTAEILYLDLKKQMPQIGIATIYRNLSELYQDGKVIKIKSKVGSDRFDGNTMPHIHFQCIKCGQILDVFLNNQKIKKLDNEIEEIARKVCSKIESNEILISGICKRCDGNNINV